MPLTPQNTQQTQQLSFRRTCYGSPPVGPLFGSFVPVYVPSPAPTPPPDQIRGNKQWVKETIYMTGEVVKNNRRNYR